MIGGVDEGDVPDLQAVAERQRGVVEVAGEDVDLADLEGALDQVVVPGGRAELFQRDREVGVLHLPGQRLLEPVAEPSRRVDVPLAAGLEEGREEREPLDVIPVGVGDEEMAADRPRSGAAMSACPRPWAPVPQSSTIEGAVRGPDLDAGRVPTIAQGSLTGLRQGAARPPEPNSHS